MVEKYISFITQKRNKAKNKFESEFYKLLNTAFYGKTMENVPNRTKVEFIRKDDTDNIIKHQSEWTFNEFISHMKIMIVIHSSKTKFLWINRFI